MSDAFAKNPKFEARNPKQARRSKIQMIKKKRFEFWSFEFVSSFGFRVSDF